MTKAYRLRVTELLRRDEVHVPALWKMPQTVVGCGRKAAVACQLSEVAGFFESYVLKINNHYSNR